MTDALLSIIVAPLCAVCDQLLDAPSCGPVCETCWQSIRPLTPPLCDVCGDPLPAVRLTASFVARPAPSPPLICRRCRGGPPLIDRSRAIGEYSGTLRALVHLLKYDRRQSVAPRLAALMLAAGQDVLDGADAVVPVPLHWTRKWRRGFNQAALLARGLGIASWAALVRRRATRSQVDLTAAGRRANVRDAFAIARGRVPWRAAWPDMLEGKVVVLVDDVSTTGATLAACAKVLRKAGAREVRALTAARVVGSPR